MSVLARATSLPRGAAGPALRHREVVPFVLLAFACSAVTFYANARGNAMGFDFRGAVWESARAVWHGRSPYPVPTRTYIHAHSNAYVYPPLLAVLAGPLGQLPFTAALIVWDVVSALAFVAALWLVGLRDWRCFALACVSFPMASGLILGQPSALLALGYALAWRFRDRAYVCALVVAGLVVLKLLAWPLVIWLFLTRRWRSAGASLGFAIALLATSWAIIGFQGLREYPRVVATVSSAFATRTHSVESVAATLDLPVSAGRLLTAALAIGLLVVAALGARRGDDLASFAAAVGAGIYASPIVHPHYLLALFVPLAVARPRVGWVWLASVLLWMSPTEPPAAPWRLDVSFCAGLVLLAGSLTGQRSRPDPIRTDPRYDPDPASA